MLYLHTMILVRWCEVSNDMCCMHRFRGYTQCSPFRANAPILVLFKPFLIRFSCEYRQISTTGPLRFDFIKNILKNKALPRLGYRSIALTFIWVWYCEYVYTAHASPFLIKRCLYMYRFCRKGPHSLMHTFWEIHSGSWYRNESIRRNS